VLSWRPLATTARAGRTVSCWGWAGLTKRAPRSPAAEVSSDSLKGRIYEFCLADLQKDEDQSFRKIKLKCEDVSGQNCLTTFYAMDFTRDKLCSLVSHSWFLGWVG
jgi:ribosomal protein S3AE